MITDKIKSDIELKDIKNLTRIRYLLNEVYNNVVIDDGLVKYTNGHAVVVAKYSVWGYSLKALNGYYIDASTLIYLSTIKYGLTFLPNEGILTDYQDVNIKLHRFKQNEVGAYIDIDSKSLHLNKRMDVLPRLDLAIGGEYGEGRFTKIGMDFALLDNVLKTFPLGICKKFSLELQPNGSGSGDTPTEPMKLNLVNEKDIDCYVCPIYIES